MIKIFPSQIVTAEHFDPFTQEMRKHPFLVWKRQGFNSPCKNNVYAFRLTSKIGKHDNYKVLIEADEYNNLHKKSYVCTDSIFLLDINNCELVGQLQAKDFLRVMQSRLDTQTEELTEAIHTLSNMAVFEARNRSDKKNDKK